MAALLRTCGGEAEDGAQACHAKMANSLRVVRVGVASVDGATMTEPLDALHYAAYHNRPTKCVGEGERTVPAKQCQYVCAVGQ